MDLALCIGERPLKDVMSLRALIMLLHVLEVLGTESYWKYGRYINTSGFHYLKSMHYLKSIHSV